MSFNTSAQDTSNITQLDKDLLHVPQSLELAVRKFYVFSSGKSKMKLTAKNCVPVLSQIYDEIYRVVPKHFINPYKDITRALDKYPKKNEVDLRKYLSQQQISNMDLLHLMFHSRVNLQKMILKLIKKDKFKDNTDFRNCIKHFKVALRTIRGWEDLWTLNYANHHKMNLEKEKFSNSWPSTLRQKKHALFDFRKDLRSGDLLLTRGTAFSGAMIARSAKIDGDFSHLAIVYIHQGDFEALDTTGIPLKKGKLYILESDFEGAHVHSLDNFLEHTKSRVAVYRNIDTKTNGELAHKAAKAFAQRATSTKLPYNFSMDLYDPEKMFCTQAMSWGYDEACLDEECSLFINKYHQEGFPKFPLFFSEVETEKSFLARHLELKIDQSFSPSDLEVDPRFELIAEWRNVEDLDDIRARDMILTKIFQWNEQLGYDIAEDSVIHSLGRNSHKLAVELNKLPKHSPQGLVTASMIVMLLMEFQGVSLNLDAISDDRKKLLIRKLLVKLDFVDQEEQARALENDFIEIINKMNHHVGFYHRIQDLEKKHLKAHGLFLSEYQIDKTMEYIRVKDCKLFHDDSDKVMFHSIYRADFKRKNGACPMQKQNFSHIW